MLSLLGGGINDTYIAVSGEAKNFRISYGSPLVGVKNRILLWEN